MYSIDQYDTKILRELCANSRMSYRDLASKVKLSKDAVYQRVQQYRDDGIIDGFVTRINQEPFCDAIVNGMVKTNDNDACKEFLSKHPRVNWVGNLLGDNDVAFTYFVKELGQARSQMKKELDKTFIKSLTFNLYTNEHKFDRLGVFGESEKFTEPEGETQPDLSTVDKSILKELSTNSRVSFAEIAHKNDVSGSTVSRRVRRLKNKGLIEGYTIALRPYRFGYESYFIGVSDVVVGQDALKNVTRRDAVTFFTETIGHYDYLCRVTVENQIQLREEMRTLQENLAYPSLDIHHVLGEPKELFVPPTTI